MMLTFEMVSLVPLVISTIALGLITAIVFRVVYNLYFHPLMHVPGPKLAAASYLYQTYFSLVGGSRFYIQISKLHEQYGV